MIDSKHVQKRTGQTRIQLFWCALFGHALINNLIDMLDSEVLAVMGEIWNIWNEMLPGTYYM